MLREKSEKEKLGELNSYTKLIHLNNVEVRQDQLQLNQNIFRYFIEFNNPI